MRDLPRIQRRIGHWSRGAKGFRQERENLTVFSPLVLPLPYSPIAQWINRRLLLRTLRRWMRTAGFEAPIVWTFLPTPLVLTLIRALEPALFIYYCIDDLASSSRAARPIRRSEEQVFREADLVFVTSEKLRERAAAMAGNVHVFPFGVDFEAFERVRLAADGAPADIRRLPRPVIGYVGGLHQFVDQDLVGAIADAMPQASVVLIGPPQTDVAALARHPNVHLLGARAHAALPEYIKAFDVGIVPYRLTEYTAHVYPTKLNEYLAMGIPVVATELEEIRRFADRHGRVIALAGQPHAFVGAVRRAVNAGGEGTEARRIAVARENGWSNRVEAMSRLIAQALDDRGRAGDTLRGGRPRRHGIAAAGERAHERKPDNETGQAAVYPVR